MNPNELREKSEKLGWSAPDDEVWKSIFDSKPKIAILAPPLDSIPSPDGNAIYTLVDDLARKMTAPVLILSKTPKAESEVEAGPERKILYYRKVFKASLLERFIPYQIRKKLFGMAGLQYFDYAKSASEVCGLLDVDVLLVQDIPWYCVLAKRKCPQLKVYLHQHIDAPMGMTGESWRKVQKACEGIVYVSDKSKASVVTKHGPHVAPSFVIYNGVDLDHYRPISSQSLIQGVRDRFGIDDDDRVLLFVGRIIPGKGPLEAAKAFLRADIDNAKFIIAGNLNQDYYGDAEYRDALVALAEASHGKIVLTGAVNQADMPALYQISQTVIIPSIQSEGLPKVMTEAIAMGKPCIVSDRGGMKELLSDGANGWLLDDPTDIDAMSDMIKTALEDDKNPALDRSLVDLDRMVAQIQGLLVHG